MTDIRTAHAQPQFGNSEFIQQLTVDRMKELAKDIKDKRTVAPIFGSGLSIAAGFPSWNEVLNSVVKENGLDKFCIFYVFEEYMKKKQYKQAAELIQSLIKDFHKKVAEKFRGNAKYPDILKSLFPNGPIVTTNYDCCLENLYGKDYEVLSDEEGFERIDEFIDGEGMLREGKKVIIKLHGSVEKESSIIISESDYKRAYRVGSPLNKVLERLNKCTCFFIGLGFSGEDDVYSPFKVIHPEKKAYALMEYPRPEPDIESLKTTKMMQVQRFFYPNGGHKFVEGILYMLAAYAGIIDNLDNLEAFISAIIKTFEFSPLP